MREYFCAYHDMLGAMRKLSDAECGRLFRALLAYSSGEKSINLQGREELLFDVFSQQIDRDAKRYEDRCNKNRDNVNKKNERKRSLTNVNDRYQEKEKEKEKEEEEPPTPLKGETAGSGSYVADNIIGMSVHNWEELHSFVDDGLSMDLINHAVDEACANGKRTWAYVRRILTRYLTQGITTLSQAKASDQKPQPQAVNGLSPWLEME